MGSSSTPAAGSCGQCASWVRGYAGRLGISRSRLPVARHWAGTATIHGANTRGCGSSLADTNSQSPALRCSRYWCHCGADLITATNTVIRRYATKREGCSGASFSYPVLALDFGCCGHFLLRSRGAFGHRLLLLLSRLSFCMPSKMRRRVPSAPIQVQHLIRVRQIHSAHFECSKSWRYVRRPVPLAGSESCTTSRHRSAHHKKICAAKPLT